MKGENIFIGIDPKSILIIFVVLAIFYVIYIIGKFIYSSTENFKTLPSAKKLIQTTATVTVTQAPTTQAPTTQAPTTKAPTTKAPTPNLIYCSEPLNNCNSCKCKINPLSFDSNNIGCITNNCTCNPNASYCKM